MEKMYVAVAGLLTLCLMTGCHTKTNTAETAPVKVTVEKIKLSATDGTQCFSGTVEESNGSALSFVTGGTIRQIFVSPGQMVAKGELLAEVDPTSLQNAYEATLATRQQAEDAYARMKQLHDNNSLPEIQWMEVQSKLKQAIAAEQIAKKSLNDTKLYAPFGGFISAKTAETGQNVLPGMPVLNLVKITQVKVKIAVPENEIASIRKGETVSVKVSALGDKTYTGTVTEKGVAAHPLSRSYDVKAVVDNRNHELLPGMVCNVSRQQNGTPAAIILPTPVVLLDGTNREFVWINANGKAEKRIVETGDLTPSGIIIRSGLAEGEEVIVSGQQKVSEGMKIIS